MRWMKVQLRDERAVHEERDCVCVQAWGCAFQRTAEWLKTRMAMAVSAAAKSGDDGEAERGHRGRVVHAPDVVEAGAVAEQPVAHERERVREREELREPGRGSRAAR